MLVDTAMGVVEAEVRGSGLPVLVLHGSPGGIDSARMMSRFLPEDEFRTVLLSRPGYLGTPLEPPDTSIDHEADLLAALLDTLGIDRAGVVAWSGGGPPGYRLAARSPDRVSSLVQIAAVSAQWVAPPTPASEAFLFGTALGNRIVRGAARLVPGRLVEAALAGEGSLRGTELSAFANGVMDDPVQREAVLDAARAMTWAGARRRGWNNDVANYGAIRSLELDRVTCPVLLVHGDADTDAIPEYSRTAHAVLPDSTLVMIERGTHLAFYAHPDAAAVQATARNWLVEHR